MWLVRATRSCSQSLVTKIWGAKRCGGHGRDARASKGGGFERIANVYGFERWPFSAQCFFRSPPLVKFYNLWVTNVNKSFSRI